MENYTLAFFVDLKQSNWFKLEMFSMPLELIVA